MGQDYESKLEILENFPFLGGETVALQRLEKYISEKVNSVSFFRMKNVLFILVIFFVHW